jgi:hypothetical protein
MSPTDLRQRPADVVRWDPFEDLEQLIPTVMGGDAPPGKLNDVTETIRRTSPRRSASRSYRVSQLFEEPGALEPVARLATDGCAQYLTRQASRSPERDHLFSREDHGMRLVAIGSPVSRMSCGAQAVLGS